MKGRGELFTNFYTDKKPKEEEQGTSNTAEQYAQPILSDSDANVRQNSENPNDNVQKFRTSSGKACGV